MTSLWLSDAEQIPDDPWDPGLLVEDLVVGAGLTGMTTALLLAHAGRNVAVVEARIPGAVTTGNTTAKLSLLQGAHLSKLRQFHAFAVVQAYVAANQEGRAWLLRYCQDHGVPFQFRPA